VAAGMAEEMPGFIPQVLRRDDVSLLRADETVFNAAGLLAMQALRHLQGGVRRCILLARVPAASRNC
jgi:hypothetical protein